MALEAAVCLEKLVCGHKHAKSKSKVIF